MIHYNGYEHLVTCEVCDSRFKVRPRLRKNLILTHWYFATRWYDAPIIILWIIVGFIHLKLTGKKGSFKHPPEHGNINRVLAETKGGTSCQ